jgi:hypothetical protein
LAIQAQRARHAWTLPGALNSKTPCMGGQKPVRQAKK